MRKKKRSDQYTLLELAEKLEELRRKIETSEAVEDLAKVAGVIFVSSFLGSALGSVAGASLKSGKLRAVLKVLLS
ncbi:hypothetical protein DRP04_14250 [Archaeoglobales archaeon]|nr:MAG: hypothetical protein DRP04_14250 [Archaeoglobales archaeon]